MLSAILLSKAIENLAAESLSFGDFEAWFRLESRDVHLWGDDRLNDLVFSVEDILSKYHFEHLRGDALANELSEMIRPFVRVPVVIDNRASLRDESVIVGSATIDPVLARLENTWPMAANNTSEWRIPSVGFVVRIPSQTESANSSVLQSFAR